MRTLLDDLDDDFLEGDEEANAADIQGNVTGMMVTVESNGDVQLGDNAKIVGMSA